MKDYRLEALAPQVDKLYNKFEKLIDKMEGEVSDFDDPNFQLVLEIQNKLAEASDILFDNDYL